MGITIGLKGEVSTLVEHEDTALSVGSGSLRVYATPCMVALMEGGACEALEGSLGDDQTTVGIDISVSHLSATPIGMEVRAVAAVTAVENNIVSFSLEAFDETGKIGQGTHKRAVVHSQRFLDKTYAKL